MKILITGANGMLAKEVKSVLRESNELICTDAEELDITDEEKKLAEEIYNRYLTHKALIAEGKLLMYHKKRLY